MTEFVFQGLLGASLSLCFVYLLLAIFTYRRLVWLQSNSTVGLNTRKLFVMTLLLVSILRFMSFGSMALLDLNSVDFKLHSASEVDDDSKGNSATKQFFEKALVVLFDFPDFCCISAYVLLIVVWAEAYLKSRRHWLSSYTFRRNWMLGYFVFNVLLYSTQTAVYSLLFIPEIDQTVQTNVIYITLAAFNVVLPILWCMIYISLTIQFSGFPYSTPDAKVRLSSLNWLGIMWSLARLGWGTVALTSVLHGWLTEAEKSKTYYTVFMVLLFLLTEVLPILFSLQRTLIQRLSEKNFDVTISGNSRDVSASNTGYGPGAVMGGQHRHTTKNALSDARVPLLNSAGGNSSAGAGGMRSSSLSDRNSSTDMGRLSLGKSPNTSSFNMLYAGRDVHGVNNNDVCLESPVTSDDFIHLYGSSHSHGAAQQATSGGGSRGVRSPVDDSNYQNKESFDERMTSADFSDRTTSFATAQTGRSPNTGWAGWLGL